jgi:hypothetical protein
MPMLNVFISSTCYDLTKERIVLKEAICHLGHNVILSESNSFPIDPSKETVDNCIDIVRKEADVLILIIKDRYGYVSPRTGRSITHMEYQTARDKGIPIFPFVYSETLRQKDLLKGQIDENGDFSKMCSFIDEIRNEKKDWTFEFSCVDKIVETVKIQLSNLLQHSLVVRNRVDAIDKRWIFPQISSEAYKLLVYREINYIERFFFQVMKDEMNRFINLRLDYKYAMSLDLEYTQKHPSEFVRWFKNVWSDMVYFLKSEGKLSKAFRDSYRADNTDFRQLYYVAKRFADIYADMLELGIHLKSEHVHSDFTNVQQKVVKIVDKSIKQLEKYPQKVLDTIELDIEKHEDSEEEVKEVIDFPTIFSITKNEIDDITNELIASVEKFQAKLKS